MPSSAAPSALVGVSVDLIAQHQAPSGAYIAAPRFDTYAYCWLRDGAFIAAAMDAHGRSDSATMFHRWAARTVNRHAHKVHALEANLEAALAGTGDPLRPLDNRYVLHTRFTTDGEEGHDEWGNFQLDGYGFWLASLARHLAHTGIDPSEFRGAIELACRYLVLTWQQPCFDSWEEYPTRRHMTTWAAIAQGLRTAGPLVGDRDAIDAADEITERLDADASAFGTLLKFVPDDGVPTQPERGPQRPVEAAVAGHERVGRDLPPGTVDGSALLVLGRFGPFPDDHPLVAATLAALEASLTVDGGVHRYLEDEYYGGGLWVVLAGALALAHAPTDRRRAAEVLSWIEAQADDDGHLGEQTSSHLRHPASLRPWTQRWGPPAKPLLWSHAMYLLGSAASAATPASHETAARPR